MTDVQPSLRQHVNGCLLLVDQALAALDLSPDDPIVEAAR
jgi:hypothetical protein